MKTVVFDTNAYDQLLTDPYTCEFIRIAIARGRLRCIVTSTVAQELLNKPHFGIPPLFPFEYRRNSVPMAGGMRAGDALGSAEVFMSHLGISKQVNDALIADTAIHAKSDWLVSNDNRMLRRLPEPNTPIGLTYPEFLAAFGAYCDQHGISTRVFLAQKMYLSAPQDEHISRRTAEDAKAGEVGPCTCWKMENWSPNLWAVIHFKSNLPIGAFHVAGPNNYTDVGWWIDKDYRGQGLGRESIDRLSLLLKARGVTRLAPISVQGKHKEISEKLRARLHLHFVN